MLSCCQLAAAIISCNCPLWVCSFSFDYLQLLTTYFQAFIDNVGIQCILSNLFQRKIKFNELNNFNGWHITSMFAMCQSSAYNTCFLLLLSLWYISICLFFPVDSVVMQKQGIQIESEKYQLLQISPLKKEWSHCKIDKNYTP